MSNFGRPGGSTAEHDDGTHLGHEGEIAFRNAAAAKSRSMGMFTREGPQCVVCRAWAEPCDACRIRRLTSGLVCEIPSHGHGNQDEPCRTFAGGEATGINAKNVAIWAGFNRKDRAAHAKLWEFLSEKSRRALTGSAD